MKILIDGLNEFYSENVRLVKTLMKRESPKEYHELLKWAFQMLYFDEGKWVEICRIDNYLHDGQKGSHIHIYDRDEVKRMELTFHEAEKLIKEISEKMLKEEFKQTVKFE
ncbi:hypothetical protein HYU06_07080 [Candidatus Woesearchaeota archaeon]|nr:hypothetical protein [Candidatus Woesearchaeota archaeon]